MGKYRVLIQKDVEEMCSICQEETDEPVHSFTGYVGCAHDDFDMALKKRNYLCKKEGIELTEVEL